MNTLQIKPNNQKAVLYLNGVELEDVKSFSLSSSDMVAAEVTITLVVEHLKGGFTPEEIDNFAAEIKKFKASDFSSANKAKTVSPCNVEKSQVGL